MKILQNKEIDFRKWDRAILNSEMPLVFAQSFYLNATSPGWKALTDEAYGCLVPLPEKKKFGFLYLMQPPFTPQLGIFGSCENPADVMELLEKRYRYISIELNAANEKVYPGGKRKRTFVLDLSQQKKYNSNTKRNISKAIKAGLRCEKLSAGQAVKLSGKLLHPFLKKKLRIPAKQIRLFDRLLQNAADENYLHAYHVRNDQDAVCALAYFISNGKHTVYLKGTTFDRLSGSMHFLMHCAISDFRKAKMQHFDFGGGQTESLAQFYSGFGASALHYKAITINNLPAAVRWIKQ